MNYDQCTEHFSIPQIRLHAWIQSYIISIVSYMYYKNTLLKRSVPYMDRSLSHRIIQVYEVLAPEA